MAEVLISPVVRAILTDDINLPADAVIRMAKARGVTAPDSSIRDAVHNIKSAIKKAQKKKGLKPTPAPAAPRVTSGPASVPEPAPTVTAPSALDLTAVLANVGLVNALVGTCGGLDQARQAAEVVRSCGGVDAFLQHLEIVAKVREA
ncbi:hypothetical protein [Frigoriglobus tundricola]|uniref:Uncharacterized protein n=1 Tax=Frigoriglobus tundricola TaxID=2774151 RepID=A0A6M5YUF1_9BACT|nr:hypothetical protein [Frigoriglobus tundricola]QJW97717.1 hypothetical protein FTUN_5295 [Frigoriglobus tundricola]